MLKIRPEFDKEIRNALCVLCGVSDLPDQLFYSIAEVKDGEKQYDVGVCIFRLTGYGGEISVLKNTLSCNDRDALVIAARAALDFIERSSEKKTAILSEENEYLANALGFIKLGGKYRADLTGYFKPCSGHKE